MGYRDELEAAQHHIQVLEEKLARAEAEKEAALAPRRRMRNRTLVVSLAAVGVLLATGVLSALLLRSRRAEAPPPTPVAFTSKNAEPLAADQAPRPAAPPPAKPDWGRGACKPVVGCYVQSHYDGRVDGLLTVIVGADGRASKATYVGSASPAVRKCLTEAGKATAFEGYEGPGGKLTCKYQGEVFGGSSQLFQSSDFVEPSSADGGAPR